LTVKAMKSTNKVFCIIVSSLLTFMISIPAVGFMTDPAPPSENCAPSLEISEDFLLSNSVAFNRSMDELAIIDDYHAEEDTASTDFPADETPLGPTPDGPVFTDVNCTLYISATRLNLRSEPSTDAEVITQLKFGDKVVCEGENDEWMKVRYNDTLGYLKADYTSKSMVFKPVTETVFVKSNTLNLRSEPSTESQIVAKLSKNSLLARIGIGDQWSKVVTSAGIKGYVSSEYLSTLPIVPETIRYSTANYSNIDQSEFDLLTRIVALESSSRYGYNGYLASASAILNRVESQRFSSSISSVVSQINQFSTFLSPRTPTDSVNLRNAIADALAGKRNLPSYVMYFIEYGAYKGNVENGGSFSRLVPYTVAYGTVWCYKAADYK
jgi:uncharacterized protein YgiM (DUF1202 family)